MYKIVLKFKKIYIFKIYVIDLLVILAERINSKNIKKALEKYTRKVEKIYLSVLRKNSILKISN